MHFRNFMAIDWSGAQGERHKGIALALCAQGDGAPRLLHPPGHARWSRAEVLDLLLRRLPPDTLVGMDLGISLPFADAGAFFPGWAQSPPDARALWAMIDSLCADDPHLGAASFVDHPGLSPYFRRHGGREGVHFHLPGALHRRGRMRVTEEAQAHAGCRPYSNFNLVGAAQVGKSSLTGMRLLHRLGGRVPVWPVDPLPESGPVVTEIYTTLAAVAAGRTAGRAKMTDHAALDTALAALGSQPLGGSGAIDDHSADALVTAAWLRTAAHRSELWHPSELTPELAATEGWTFGAA
ncbi:hypothetical protein [Novosphingobium sp. P6W]|uniref:hypothetical protein n=1 Tax=Novosphingobium sp. P6W TaxID=1609758 RepID=UPI0005C2B975|nr:hypothetical protein [Novosphingobium sp. P6W]AXB77573.1 hypothetical protein TQ38_014535 [Novosphingobium sp. P6W]KIS33935.1 hypothetical protein TQ38_04450 [Novosphingobium sp. P6W]